VERRIIELHFITPIRNVQSILRHGILSNERVEKHTHRSVANSNVQKIRDNIRIPNGLNLHQYANLYFDARNPMLYTLMTNGSDDLCILRLDKFLMTSPGVVISDRNAASRYANFWSYSEAMVKLDLDAIYAHYWANHVDPIELMEHKSIKCAEVLVPQQVEPKYITGAYVPDTHTKELLTELGFDREIIVNANKFFNKSIKRH